MPIEDTEESPYIIVTAKESQASMIPLVRSGSRLRFSAAVDVQEDDDEQEKRQYSNVPAIDSQASLIPLVRSGSRLRFSAAVSCTRTTMIKLAASDPTINQKIPYLLSVNEEKRQYSIIPANESQASMTPLVESGSTLKLSVAIREYEGNEEKRQSTTTTSYRSPERKNRIKPIYAQKSYHTPSPSTSYMTIRDTDERQYSIIPANKSQASMIALVGSGSRLRFSAVVDVHEDDDD
ncbi:hypothetical protein J6590_082133 [Homalodisca vitripennis]|nr:hypothetical protein J6590_082133 [Homalodisca vitripennis]